MGGGGDGGSSGQLQGGRYREVLARSVAAGCRLFRKLIRSDQSTSPINQIYSLFRLNSLSAGGSCHYARFIVG